MSYTIFELPFITPKYKPVLVVGQLQQALNPGAPVVYPDGSRLLYSPVTLNRYDSDSTMRLVLLSDPQGTATEAEILLAFPDILDAKQKQLLRAAEAYEYDEINGSAMALLTVGVLQGKPLSLSIKAWLADLWDEHYRRKTLITFDTEPNIDFSSLGNMPCSIQDLMEELAV